MTRLNCDTCAHWDDGYAESICLSCCDLADGTPANYTPINETVYDDDYEEILNALATMIELCKKYKDIVDGCETLCPLRSSFSDQEAGLAFCSLEAGIPPTDWVLLEPDDEEDFPILLETDYIETYEDDEDDTSGNVKS